MKIIVNNLIEIDTKNYSGLTFKTINRRFKSKLYKIDIEFRRNKYTLYISDNPFLANRIYNSLFSKLKANDQGTLDMKDFEKSLIKDKEQLTFTNQKLMKLLKIYITEDINNKGIEEER